jgi:anti-anti-sigma factor
MAANPLSSDVTGTGSASGDAASHPSKTLFCSMHEGDVNVVMLSRPDILDGHYIQELGNELTAFVAPLDAPRLVIDLENVRFLSSAALGMLVTIRNAVNERGGRMCLAGVRNDVKQVFELTRMDIIFEFAETRAEAVKSMS